MTNQAWMVISPSSLLHPPSLRSFMHARSAPPTAHRLLPLCSGAPVQCAAPVLPASSPADASGPMVDESDALAQPETHGMVWHGMNARPACFGRTWSEQEGSQRPGRAERRCAGRSLLHLFLHVSRWAVIAESALAIPHSVCDGSCSACFGLWLWLWLWCGVHTGPRCSGARDPACSSLPLFPFFPGWPWPCGRDGDGVDACSVAPLEPVCP